VFLALLIKATRARRVLEIGTSNGYSTLWLADAVGPAGEAGQFLAGCGAAAYDFIFLDSDREQYVGWWPAIQRILAPGCLIVVDNAISHAHQMVDFTAQVAASAGYPSSLSPIGNGELVILKEAVG